MLFPAERLLEVFILTLPPVLLDLSCKGVLERDIEQVAPNPDSSIILYCGGGYRSAIAAESLQKMGYSAVESMDGGFRGWVMSGHPIEIA